ncbi:MAG: SGNH/GDSL hydrolase family protein, partial [Anaerolineales bacterium]|nr:SGNH/GDSL hydrolase family protein [Anaerolineales bacterium]
QTDPTPAPAEQAIDSPTAVPATSTSSPTPKPPLAKDAWKQMPAVPTGVSDAMREVYQRGLELGNDPTHFSVIGDCQNVSSYFLAVFEQPDEFSLGEEYDYLQSTIDYYQGSFSRVSVAVKGGFNAAAVISPLRSDKTICGANESPLDCELRLWRPSVVFVSMETWWSHKPAEEYEKYMRKVLDRIIEYGAVPIIATKADNLEGDNSINATVAKLAYEYEIPLWNFWAAVQPLPDHGLSPDGFHLTFGRNFFDDPKRMLNAWPWRNLTALQTLDVVRKGLAASE